MIRPRLADNARVLDIGSGLAREAGLDAFGVEISEFEVEFARRRLQLIRPQDKPEDIYWVGDARLLDIEPESVDAVTLWIGIYYLPQLYGLAQ